MDKLKSNSYRQRSYSNQAMLNGYQSTNQNNSSGNMNKLTLQESLQKQYNSLQQQQQLIQTQYPLSKDSAFQSYQQQDNNRRTSITQLKTSSHITTHNAQDINNSISILQNYRADFNNSHNNNNQNNNVNNHLTNTNIQKQNVSFHMNNQNESLQSSIPLGQSNQQTINQLQQQQNSQQNFQFCKNFVEFLKNEDSQKWIQVTNLFDELKETVQMKLQHSQIYNKSQKILEFITLNAEFIPKKFDILMSCLTQEFQTLREMYLEIQTLIEKNKEDAESEQQREEIYNRWEKQIECISNQYFKIFTRHVQQYQSSNLLLSQQKRKPLLSQQQHSNERNDISFKQLQKSSNTKQNMNSQNQNQSFINQTFSNNNNNNQYNNNSNKENSFKNISVEEYQKFKREHILDKYSNENTLNLKIQQLEKQVKQLQSVLQAKTKEFDICKSEKSRGATKIEELENKIHDLEKNIQFTDPNRFTSFRTGEAEYLIRRHENEKNELKRVIEQKNQEIKSYRIELEGILGEIDNTSRNLTENNHKNSLYH